MKLVRTAAAMVLAALLVSCGGGGSGSGGTSSGLGGSGPGSGNPSALDAGVYRGNYVWPCQPLKNGTNYETGAPLYVKLMLSIGSAFPSPETPIAPRFDFYDDNACAGAALATLQTQGTNMLYLVSETTVNGAAVHNVVLAFGALDSAFYAPGPTADTVLYGAVLRLQLPRILVTGFYVQDLWSLQNDALYEGNTTYGPDGYPQALLTTPSATKVAQLPPPPGAPCSGNMALGWSSTTATCSGVTVPTGSGRTVQLVDTLSSSVSGTATATCTNGYWSTATNIGCDFTYTPPPPCPVQTITWTSGTNTCSGTTSSMSPGSTQSVVNTVAGLDGGQYMTCQNDGTWTTWMGTTGRCDVPPPPITDPVQLAQAKNCLACHTVLEPGYSAGLPSFERIANHYRNSPPAAGVLEAKIKAGGAGTFGTTPMPANPQVTDADLAILVPWILAQPQ